MAAIGNWAVLDLLLAGQLAQQKRIRTLENEVKMVLVPCDHPTNAEYLGKMVCVNCCQEFGI